MINNCIEGGSLFEFIGLVFAWIIGVLIFSMIFNSIRASRGIDIKDGTTAFFQGAMFGPLGVIAAIAPQTNTSNRVAMAIGGIVGTFIFWDLYVHGF